MSLTWSHAFVNVSNLSNMLAFYCDVLGFKISDRTEDIAFISQLKDEHHQLAFHESQSAPDTPKRVGHFAFRVESIKDVRNLYARLQSHDSELSVFPVTHGNTWSIYFNDPEGNGLEVFCDTPWQVSQPFSKPWDVSLDQKQLEQYTKQLIADHEVANTDAKP